MGYLQLSFRTLEFWWLADFALSLALAGVVLFTRWRSAGIVAAALLMGTSSQLALTAPVWFQAISMKTPGHAIYLLAIMLQVAVSVLALFLRRSDIGFGRIAGAMARPRTVLLVFLMLGTSVSAFEPIANADISSFWRQLLASAGFLAINMTSLIALYFSLPEAGLVRFKRVVTGKISLPGNQAQTPNPDRLVPIIAALWVFSVSALLCVGAFQRLPHVEDEVAYLFQAKTLLGGQLAVPAPVAADAFKHYLLNTVDGRWFAVTSPGWPALLSSGVVINLYWLVNPVLAAITILLAHALIRRIADRGSANLLVLFLAVSPWFLAMSASLMSHTSALCLMLASWLALVHAKSKQSAVLALLAGSFMGYLFLTRPLDGLIAGLLTGLWSLSFLQLKRGTFIVLAYGLGCVVVGSLIFPFNEALTGHFLTTPLNHYVDQLWHPGANRMGFGVDIGPPNQWGRLDLYPGHSPFEALINFQHNTYMLNFELFGWGIGSLFLVFVHLIWGRWTRLEVCSAIFIIILAGTYSLYWFNASFYIGPRYWYVAIVPLVLITIGGLRTLVDSVGAFLNVPHGGARLGTVLATLGVIALISFLPWRGSMKYFQYGGYHADYREIEKNLAGKESLVFIRDTSNSDFGSALFLDQPVLSDSKVIFARELGPDSDRMVAAEFPKRSIYFATGRSGKYDSARITMGPLSMETMMQTGGVSEQKPR